MRTFRLWMLAAGVVVLVFAAFSATVPFQLARVRTSAKNDFTTIAGPKTPVARPEAAHRIFLHVENRIGLGGALAWDMRRQLQDAGFNVILVNNKPGPDDFPYLLIGVRARETFWSPFYAFGSVRIRAKYASFTSHIALEGNNTLPEDAGELRSGTPLLVPMEATVENSTVGIVSYPAFYKILVHDSARDMVEYLRKAIEEANTPTATPYEK